MNTISKIRTRNTGSFIQAISVVCVFLVIMLLTEFDGDSFSQGAIFYLLMSPVIGIGVAYLRIFRSNEKEYFLEDSGIRCNEKKVILLKDIVKINLNSFLFDSWIEISSERDKIKISTWTRDEFLVLIRFLLEGTQIDNSTFVRSVERKYGADFLSLKSKRFPKKDVEHVLDKYKNYIVFGMVGLIVIFTEVELESLDFYRFFTTHSHGIDWPSGTSFSKNNSVYLNTNFKFNNIEWSSGTYITVISNKTSIEYVVHPGSHFYFDNVVWPVGSIVRIINLNKEIRVLSSFFYRGKRYPKNSKFIYAKDELVNIY